MIKQYLKLWDTKNNIKINVQKVKLVNQKQYCSLESKQSTTNIT